MKAFLGVFFAVVVALTIYGFLKGMAPTVFK